MRRRSSGGSKSIRGVDDGSPDGTADFARSSRPAPRHPPDEHGPASSAWHRLHRGVRLGHGAGYDAVVEIRDRPKTADVPRLLDALESDDLVIAPVFPGADRDWGRSGGPSSGGNMYARVWMAAGAGLPRLGPTDRVMRPIDIARWVRGLRLQIEMSARVRSGGRITEGRSRSSSACLHVKMSPHNWRPCGTSPGGVATASAPQSARRISHNVAIYLLSGEVSIGRYPNRDVTRDPLEDRGVPQRSRAEADTRRWRPSDKPWRGRRFDPASMALATALGLHARPANDVV